jgi:DNA-binding transcriptional LysR family regulator
MADKASRYKQNRLQQLRGFCYAARTQSMSKAAEKLYLSQPSISLQIKALERELGTRLFDRRGPKITLTRDGEALLEIARTLVEGFEQIEEQFAARRDSPDRGIVRIAAGGSTIQYILPPYVEKFVHKYPAVDLRFHNVTGKAGLVLLRAGEVDFAVGPMFDTPTDIEFYPRFVYEPTLITAKDHPLASRRRITLRDISKYPLILPPRDQSTYRFVQMVFSDHSLDYDVRLQVGGYEVIKRYVQLGLGISIVMSHCLDPRDRLHTASVSRYFPKRAYGIVLRKRSRLSPAAERFIHAICPDWPRPSAGTRTHRRGIARSAGSRDGFHSGCDGSGRREAGS